MVSWTVSALWAVAVMLNEPRAIGGQLERVVIRLHVFGSEARKLAA